MGTLPSVSSRGVITSRYALITAENHVDNRLPGLDGTIARPLATPRFGNARFGQYLLEFGPCGRSVRPLGGGYENFLYQLSGAVAVETPCRQVTLVAGAFFFMPSGVEFSVAVEGSDSAVMLWTKRLYEAVEGLALPEPVLGRRSEISPIEPSPPAAYTYQELIPCADPSYDMAMNILTAPRGGSIGLVEIHHQEHGLLMLEGQGVYYLAGDYHEVNQGDYVYMAPYCPQSFWGTGPNGAAYILYKDVNRDGF